ncbi:hypothetical protein FRC11_012924 [Ceratobasidium sp. 423]|nr:hypothetical protein FRC11_012924 [Ceratobasidium sp. 423]
MEAVLREAAEAELIALHLYRTFGKWVQDVEAWLIGEGEMQSLERIRRRLAPLDEFLRLWAVHQANEHTLLRLMKEAEALAAKAARVGAQVAELQSEYDRKAARGK